MGVLNVHERLYVLLPGHIEDNTLQPSLQIETVIRLSLHNGL